MGKFEMATCMDMYFTVLKCFVLVLVFVLACPFFSAGGGGRQDVSAKKISIALKDVSLRAALIRISDVAHVSFVYVNSTALDKNKVSITARNEKVSVLLKKLLTPHSFSYTVVDDRIVIRYMGIAYIKTDFLLNTNSLISL
jgi:hypothetical protein